MVGNIKNVMNEITESGIKNVLEQVKLLAEKNNFTLTENAKKVVKAKLRFFGEKDWSRCPCDPNSDRACISEHCKNDILTQGKCHCSLYKLNK